MMKDESSRTVEFDAVVLAGGRGNRLGGIDKAELRLAGARLVDRVVIAARADGARRTIVVGPDHTASPGVVVVRENPPFGGPLAALAAALGEVDSSWVMVLSCDLVYPEAVCATLVAALAMQLPPGNGSEPGSQTVYDGALICDEHGQRQWLAGIYSTSALQDRFKALSTQTAGDFAHMSLRRVLAELALYEVPALSSLTFDIDRPEDLAKAQDSWHDTDPKGQRS